MSLSALRTNVKNTYCAKQRRSTAARRERFGVCMCSVALTGTGTGGFRVCLRGVAASALLLLGVGFVRPPPPTIYCP